MSKRLQTPGALADVPQEYRAEPEQPGAGLAWPEPLTLRGREAVLASLRQALDASPVVVLRAPRFSGGTRVLEELCLREPGALLLDARDPAIHDALRRPAPLLAIDNGDCAGPDTIEALAGRFSPRPSPTIAGRACVAILVRPAGALDRRLARQVLPAVDLPPLDVSATRLMLADLYPAAEELLPLAEFLVAKTRGLPAAMLASLALLSHHGGGRLEPSPSSPALSLPLVRSTIGNLTQAPPEEWLRALFPPGSHGRAVVSLFVAHPWPLTTALAQAAAATLLGAEGDHALAGEIDRLQAIGVLARSRSLFFRGDWMEPVVRTLLNDDELAAAYRALESALAALPGSAAPAVEQASRALCLVGLGKPGCLEAASAAAERLVEARWPDLAVDLLRRAAQRAALNRRDRLCLARALLAMGDPESALAEAKQALEAGATEPARLFRAEVLVRLGRPGEAAAELDAGSVPEHEEARVAALAMALSLSDQAGRALALTTGTARPPERTPYAVDLCLAELRAYRALGELDKAEEAGLRARFSARELRDARREALALLGLGTVHEDRAQLHRAESLYLDALRLSETAADLEGKAWALDHVGGVLCAQGRARAAVQHLEEALALAHLLVLPALAARVRVRLGRALLEFGDLSAAERCVTSPALPEASSEDESAAGARSLVLAEIALARGDTRTSEERLHTARRNDHRAYDPATRLQLRWVEALLALRSGRYDDAWSLATRLEQEARAARMPAWGGKAQSLLASIQLDRGSPPFLQARTACFEALSLLGRESAPELLAGVEAMLARASSAPSERAFHAHRALKLLADAARLAGEAEQRLFSKRPDRANLVVAIERIQGEQALASPQDPALPRLLEINRRLIAERDSTRLLETIADAAVDLFGAERAFLLTARQHGAPPKVKVARGPHRQAILEDAAAIVGAVVDRVLQSGQTEAVVASSAANVGAPASESGGERAGQNAAPSLPRSVLCVPLRYQGTVVGALYLEGRGGAPGFPPDAIGAVEALADQASIALALSRAEERADAGRRDVEPAGRLSGAQPAPERVLAPHTDDGENALRASDPARFGHIVGTSEAMVRVVSIIQRVAASDLPVLLTGETGTGKELVARTLFERGLRRDRPFVSINCGAFNEALLETELFGHVRGAFTGAEREKEGLFHLANTGTLFLDEVGDMSLSMQVKLLRALQDGEVRKVGGKEATRVNVRIIAATNRDLARLMREGRFREDLYYRLNVVSIVLPPLRERRADIPLICQDILDKIPWRYGKPWRLSPEALALLTQFDWPGNIRELTGTLTSAAVFASSEVIGVPDFVNKPELLSRPRGAAPVEPPVKAGQDAEAELSIDRLEHEAILRAIEVAGGNKAKAARLLGIGRRTLYDKLQRLQGAPAKVEDLATARRKRS